MAKGGSGDLTALLQAWSEGDEQAFKELVPRVQNELRRLAGRFMAREAPNHPLQPTALINEAYIRLIQGQSVRWQNRAHFFAVSAQVMRRILVDIARAQSGPKRKDDGHMPLNEAYVFHPDRPRDIVLLDEALTRLAEIDPRKCQVIELRFFGGLTVEETGLVLGLSRRTVEREFTLAKAWLYRELSQNADA